MRLYTTFEKGDQFLLNPNKVYDDPSLVFTLKEVGDMETLVSCRENPQGKTYATTEVKKYFEDGVWLFLPHPDQVR